MIAVLLALTVSGWGTALAEGSDERVRAALERIIPGGSPDEVVPSELSGIYRVVFGAEVFYITEDGRYLLSGNLLDLRDGTNLTEARRASGRLKVIDAMDEAKMIVYGPKEVKHSITVFTDIDCPYCRRMHQEMDELNARGIEVRYLLFPRAGVNSKSYDKAVSVWCAEDRQQALTDAKLGKAIEMKACDNPVQEHMALVERLGITGTPTSVLENGVVIPGYVPVGRLERVLADEGRM